MAILGSSSGQGEVLEMIVDFDGWSILCVLYCRVWAIVPCCHNYLCVSEKIITFAG